MPFSQIKLYKSLRFRLTLWNTAVVFFTVLATLVIVHIGLRWTVMQENDERLHEELAELGQAIKAFYPDLDTIHEEMNRMAIGHAHSGQFVQVLNDKGVVVWSSVNTPEEFRDRPSLGTFSLITVGHFRVAREIWTFPGMPLFNVRVGANIELLEADVRRLTNILSIVGALILGVAPVGGYWLAGRATRPLAHMVRTAANLRPSKLDERLPIAGAGDEMDRLSATINGLLDRIAAYVEQNRQFIANAAHELRSPLAAIQSSVEVALNVERSPAEYQELLGELVEESSNLRLLVNQLLLLAESDGESPRMDFEEVNLTRVVARSTEMFRAAAEDKGLEVVNQRLDEVRVPGREAHLRQVINNLIDNGIKFSKPGGKLTVSLIADPDRHIARLRVTDTGEGIPAHDLPHIFDRFYRGDKSRQREHTQTGTGLGLSIVQAIVKTHNGTIDVQSEVGQGTTFEVTIPRRVAKEPEGMLPLAARVMS